jgi:KUP system potassium uptake protein
VSIHHTSEHERGQVYAPTVNWGLCAAVTALVVGFGSSERLASAYGIAVTGTMAITTILFFFVVRRVWRKALWVVVPGAVAFLAVDLLLFAASLTKVRHGGALPIAVGLAVFTILTTWRRGRQLVLRRVIRHEGPLRRFVEEARTGTPPTVRVPGTAVFLAGDRESTPLALRDNLKHNHVMHESVLILHIDVEDVPHVAPGDRLEVDALGYRDDGITLVTARYGYQDTPNLPRAVAQVAHHGAEGRIDAGGASYLLSRITVVWTGARTMRRWRKHLFIAMWRNQAEPIRYLGLPDERTLTVGSVIEI